MDTSAEMEFYNGVVLIQLIDFIGEDLFIEKIKGYNEYEKLRLKAILDVGFFEIKLDKYRNKKTSAVFPKLNFFLNNGNR